MTPTEFIKKWEKSQLKESAAAQSHFNDLCELLEVPKPTEEDAVGDSYCFEKGATKSTGGQGFADVWKKGCFGWEYKGPKANLKDAYTQLQRYAVALENPPLLIVSDTKKIIIHTNWTNTVSETHVFELADLLDATNRDRLRNCFLNPEALKPTKTRDQLTREAADEFSELAQRLRDRDHDPEEVAHFVNRLVFCMFAEDVGLLPDEIFLNALIDTRHDPKQAQKALSGLFENMQTGGLYGSKKIPWFNGGLFDSPDALPLESEDIDMTIEAARLDWSDIDPSILGTLFERGLDPSKRSQLGAHYTDRDKIMLIVNPLIVRPLESEWAEIAPEIEAELEDERAFRIEAAQTPAAAKSGALTRKANNARRRAQKLHDGFLEKLATFRVLDPACGSGNFLYLSLKALKDIEHKANIEAEALGLPRAFPRVGPDAVRGIEINHYAAELARVSIWIGEIQWMRANGFEATTDPILKPLENIECRDAVMNQDGTEVDWPSANVIVGNPPFLGAKLMRGSLGDRYVDEIRSLFAGRLSNFVDLVCYWFEKSRQLVEAGLCERVGLVATNSIRGGTNQQVLKKVTDQFEIYDAWSDEPWVVDGAAVRISIVCFSNKDEFEQKRLDGKSVKAIHSSLSEGVGSDQSIDLSNARKLKEAQNVAFIGVQKTGPFDIPGETARKWLKAPQNANGSLNSAVLKPYWNGAEIVRRPRDVWIIDFGADTSEPECAAFELPFSYAQESIKPIRQKNKEQVARDLWWRFWRPRPDLYKAADTLDRLLVTPRVSKHRIWRWMHANCLPDSAVVAVAKQDDLTFGILHSRFHEIWSLRMCTWLGKGNDPRYTPTTCFETFPFPDGLTLDLQPSVTASNPRAKAISEAAATLNGLRENWLNPPEWVQRVPEVKPGYPDRLVPKDAASAEQLKERTLTNLYNARPAWLEFAHRELDQAVADAYGWKKEFDAGTLSDNDVLARLFEINQNRSSSDG